MAVLQGGHTLRFWGNKCKLPTGVWTHTHVTARACFCTLINFFIISDLMHSLKHKQTPSADS